MLNLPSVLDQYVAALRDPQQLTTSPSGGPAQG
jgi:hypothetical protein